MQDFFFFFLPKNRLAANVLRLQCSSLQKFIAQTIVEGTVKAWGTAVCMQYSETLHLIFPIDQQFCFVAINTDQNHILHGCTHVAAKQFIGYSICEKLQRGRQEQRTD